MEKENGKLARVLTESDEKGHLVGATPVPLPSAPGSSMKRLLTTKEVAELLNIHEKMVYTLVAEKAMPATKIAGKWLFPQYLIEQWVENE
jgi:excisionase family DNA binding protein